MSSELCFIRDMIGYSPYSCEFWLHEKSSVPEEDYCYIPILESVRFRRFGTAPVRDAYWHIGCAPPGSMLPLSEGIDPGPERLYAMDDVVPKAGIWSRRNELASLREDQREFNKRMYNQILKLKDEDVPVPLPGEIQDYYNKLLRVNV